MSITDNDPALVLALLVAGLQDDIAVEEDEAYGLGDLLFFGIGIEATAPLHLLAGVRVNIANEGLGEPHK